MKPKEVADKIFDHLADAGFIPGAWRREFETWIEEAARTAQAEMNERCARCAESHIVPEWDQVGPPEASLNELARDITAALRALPVL